MIPRLLLVLLSALPFVQQPQKITINFPTRSGASWPLFIAKEGGYYQKYGLDVNLAFATHPAGIEPRVNPRGSISNTAKQGTVRLAGSSARTVSESIGRSRKYSSCTN